MGGEGPMPTEEEMQAALDEQMAQLTVPDVIVQTVVTLINLGARKLGLTGQAPGGGGGELDEARMAIEGARALLPLLPTDIPQVREALSQLQMAYARAAGGGGGDQGAGDASAAPGAPGGQATPAAAPGEGAPSPAEEAERAKARAKIWTPGQR